MSDQTVTACILIRRATEKDAQAVAQLSAELGYPATAEVMRGRIRAVLTSASDLLMVATDSAAIVVGWLQARSAHVIESGFRVEIVGLIVSSSMRRCGVGRALVDEAERWAKSLSAEAIVVRSNVKRGESHAFYPALGYSSLKTQTVYRKPLVDSSTRSLSSVE